MTSKECELQLNQLIIDWDEDKATRLNATDIEAIKHLLLENQMQHDEITQLKKELAVLRMSEEEWLDYAINYNLEQLEKRCMDE